MFASVFVVLLDMSRINSLCRYSQAMKLWCFILVICLIISDSVTKNTRYVLYDVNPGEGFNLRRDVYMRMAVFVRKLNIEDKDTRWVLVLPPWGHLYHWQTRDLGHQIKIPWRHFFDIPSLARYVPVMEFEDWIEVSNGVVDSVHYLQGYKEGWGAKFEEKYDVRDCLEPARYKRNKDGDYRGQFFFYDDVVAKKFQCLSVQGHTSVLSSFVRSQDGDSVMLDRAENLLHDFFGDADYWAARRSMRFSSVLESVAAEFRLAQLESSEQHDNTVKAGDWTAVTSVERSQRGGNYACVHMRRGDFARSRGGVPSVAWVGKQLVRRLADRKLDTLFVASDASEEEMATLRQTMTGVNIVRYTPSDRELALLKDGGVAIVDQIICSHAQYFIGTRESTFTFRIQEEREMMGFLLEDTFDMLCGEGELECEGGTRWMIDWGQGRDWTLPPASDDRSDQ